MNCQEIKEKISIEEVLDYFKISPAKKNRNGAFYFALDRDETLPSLFVDTKKNRAFDFGSGKSYDVIDIVQHFHNCKVSDAIKFLQSDDLPIEKNILKKNIQLQKSYEIIKISEVKHPALIQYLDSRKVLKPSYILKEIHYKVGENKYFGLGFENDSGGFEIRNKYSKICLGKKDVTFIRNSKNLQMKELLIFEGFFDFLTFKALTKSRIAEDCLILNSTAMLFKVKSDLLSYDKLSLFLDNDNNGKNVVRQMMNEYLNVEDCSTLYHNYKDLNDWFCK